MDGHRCDDLIRSLTWRSDWDALAIASEHAVDDHRFDRLTRSWTGLPSRRDLLRGLVSIELGLAALPLQDAAEAKKKRRKHNHKKRQAVPCTEWCSAAFVMCLDRPEGRPFCASDSLASNCVNCATDQDCLETPETPYCITGATDRTTGEPIPLNEFCPEMIDGVCAQIAV